MVNVQFQEENTEGFTSRQILGAPIVPGAVHLLERWGIAKSGKQAEYVLVSIIIVCLAIIGLTIFLHSRQTDGLMTVEQVKQLKQP